MYCLHIQIYTNFKVYDRPQFEQYLKVHTKSGNRSGGVEVEGRGQHKFHHWVKKVAQSSTELSVGTICFLLHQQQAPTETKQPTATET